MNLLEQQTINEYAFDKSHTVETIQDSYSNFIEPVSDYIKICKKYFNQTDFDYVLKDGTKKHWDTKEERFQLIKDMNHDELAAICWDTVVWCTVKPMVTFTEVVGKLYKKLSVTTDRQGIESASDFIALLSKTPFIKVVYPTDAEEGVLMVQSNIDLDEDMQSYLANQRYTLPSLTEPEELISNNQTGYKSIQGSVILGGNHHDGHLALDHINRQNKIALSVEARVLHIAEPKFKDKIDETDKERADRYASFKQCNVESFGVIAKLIQQGNKFHLTNKFDNGGRTYTQGYHCNLQGDNYRKSALVLANKEIVEM